MKSILTGPVFLAVLLLLGCAGPDRAHRDRAVTPSYETAEQINAMPVCTAKVIETAPCYVGLKTSDGKTIYIGSPASKADVVGFLGGLIVGQSYRFPEAFVNYQRNRTPDSP
jgi:hypothetical protein